MEGFIGQLRCKNITILSWLSSVDVPCAFLVNRKSLPIVSLWNRYCYKHHCQGGTKSLRKVVTLTVIFIAVSIPKAYNQQGFTTYQKCTLYSHNKTLCLKNSASLFNEKSFKGVTFITFSKLNKQEKILEHTFRVSHT